MVLGGHHIPAEFLAVHTQPEVGEEAYDQGAQRLVRFFAHELEPYLGEGDLAPLGRRIIECALEGGTVTDFAHLLPAQI
jgi:hypothetical protein